MGDIVPVQPGGKTAQQVPRDIAVDFIRGIAICVIVINHLPVPSLFYVLTVERIGIVTCC